MSRLRRAFVIFVGLSLVACGSISRDDLVPDASPNHVVTEEPDGPGSIVPDRVGDVVIEETPVDPSCIIEESSSLPGVRFAVRAANCTFTLAEAAAGIAIPYDLIVDQDVTGFVTRVYAYMPDVANLLIAERVQGNQQSYCVCDRGLPYPGCPDSDGGLSHPTFNVGGDATPWYEATCAPFTIPRGIYHRVFRWDGHNWFGPSDTQNPEGLPFPAGDYELGISTNTGTLEGNDAVALGANARVHIHLVP